MKPRLFIGSSSEALPIARAIQKELSGDLLVTIWDQDVFRPGTFTVEALLNQVRQTHFALFVFAPDDVTRLRKKTYSAVRDNVVFELGLFMSQLDRRRCLFLLPTTATKFRIPTDLSGITALTYDYALVASDVHAAVQPAANELREHVKRLVRSEEAVSLTGRWRQAWSVQSKQYPPLNESIAEVLQVGGDVYGEFVSGTQTYRLTGTIDRGNVVTGRWYDVAGGGTYFGAFQLIVAPIPNRMNGRWVGFRETNRVDGGEWIWERLLT
jgi:hypothetical protein